MSTHIWYPTPTFRVDREVSSSEAAALHGYALPALFFFPRLIASCFRSRKALTPWISGVISGAGVAIMWTVAGIIYLMKRKRRTQRARAHGLKRREVPPRRSETIVRNIKGGWVVPDDPACTPGVEEHGMEERREGVGEATVGETDAVGHASGIVEQRRSVGAEASA
jgi:hypothetical protein